MPGNQTREEWLELPQVAENPMALGTGAVLSKPSEKKELIAEITYEDILERDRSTNFYAFAWVPHAVASYEQVRNASCGGRCSQTCKRPGCLCNRSIGRCA